VTNTCHRLTSECWKFFEPIYEDTDGKSEIVRGKCKHCSIKLKCVNGTSGLISHMKSCNYKPRHLASSHQIQSKLDLAMTSKLATAKENMILKFEKYFSDTKDILVHIIASIFHPQYKTSIIDAVFSTQRAILLEKIVKIFERNYVSNDEVAQTVSNDVIRTLSFDAIDEDLAFLGVNSNRPQLMSMRQEFDQYINEPPMKCTDILVYWRSKEQVYPHLVKMALDFLCIQLSSVASEFAFSGSGRVMDDYRSRLAEATLEMLMQLQSWLKNSKKHNF